ncbi:MAG: right-handed parallel beta-helix repeat-containing protein, partial [Elusimicrobia bacterium]|nr:right-handed parallel beta-helix repeat-containing protein [Elusimicrobiota bacterium]
MKRDNTFRRLILKGFFILSVCLIPHKLSGSPMITDSGDTFPGFDGGTSSVTLTGTFYIGVADDFKNKRSTEFYLLKTADKTYRLQLSDDSPRLPSGSQVSVSGSLQELTLRASSVMADNSQQNMKATAASLNNNSPTGNIRVAVILFNFADLRTQPITLAQAFDGVFGNNKSVKKFYEENSFGQAAMVGKNGPGQMADVYGWYESSLMQKCPSVLGSMQAGNTIRQDLGIDPNSYDRFLFVFPHMTTCNEAGSAALYQSDVYVGVVPGKELSVISGELNHELGHTYGLRHASLIDCKDKSVPAGPLFPLNKSGCKPIEYGDEWDTMGSGYQYFKHFNANKKSHLGYIPSNRIQEISASGDYRVYRLEDNQTGPQALKLRRPNTMGEDYFIGYRQPVGLDSDGQGIYSSWGSEVHLVDVDGSRDTYGYSFLIDPDSWWLRRKLVTNPLVDGLAISDPYALITIRQMDHDDVSARIRVLFGCAQSNPVVAMSPLNNSGPASWYIEYVVAISNRDVGPGCADTVFELQGINSSGGGTAFESGTLVIPPGWTQSTKMIVNIPEGSPEGSYVVGVDAYEPNTNYGHGAGVRGSYEVTCESPNSGQKAGSSQTTGACAIPQVSVILSPSNQAGGDGRTVDYSVSVRNDGLSPAAFALTPQTPMGWDSILDAPTLSLSPGQTGVTGLHVTVPYSYPDGVYDVGVLAVDGGDATHRGYGRATYTINYQGSQPSLAPTVTINPSAVTGRGAEIVNFTVSITNNSPFSSIYQLSAQMPSNAWTAAFSAFSLALTSGQTETVQMQVSVPGGLSFGSYNIIVRAADPDVSNTEGFATATYTIRTCQMRVPTLTVSPVDYVGNAGQTALYTLNISNNDDPSCPSTTFQSGASGPEGWNVVFDPPSLNLNPQRGEIVWMSVTSPANTEPGQYPITANLSDITDPSHKGSVSVSYTIPTNDPSRALYTSVRSGNWSDPATWGGAPPPGPGNQVNIFHDVTVDIPSAQARSVHVGWFGTNAQGSLIFSRSVDSHLTITDGDLIVHSGAWLDMGTEASPIPQSVKARLQFASSGGGYRLLVESGAKFTVRGAVKAAYSELMSDALAGANSISINGSDLTGWSIGDMITLGSERVAISSIQPGNPAVIGLAVPLSINHNVADSVQVDNLTRNVLIDAPVGRYHILVQSLGFEANYGEFYGFGLSNVGGDVRAGIVLDARGGSAVAARIQNSVIEDGISYALSLYGSSQNVISGNVIFKQWGGIYLGANSKNNLISANHINILYGTGWGVAANELGAKSNTISFNSIKSPAGGIMVSEPLNLIVSNTVSGSLNVGIELGWGAKETTLLSNIIYSNARDMIVRTYQSKSVVLGGSLGYDLKGNSRPASDEEVAYGLGDGASLILKEVKVNPAKFGTFANALSSPGSYLLSYGQNGEKGTARLWGDYTVSSSTMNLNYGLRSYMSEHTVPKLMRGAGHSVSQVSTMNAYAVSQIVTIKRTQGMWRVEGSVSGFLGTFAGSIGTQGFPTLNPQFSLNFTEGPSPQEGDFLDFVIMAKSEDVNLPKKLLFGPASISVGGRSKLTIAPGAVLRVSGSPTNPSLMDRLDPAAAYYTIVNNGVLDLSYVAVNNADEKGLQTVGSAGLKIASCTFDFAGQGNSPQSSYITAQDLTGPATFYGIIFNQSRSVPNLRNVTVLGISSKMRWQFVNWGGPMGGENFDDDSNERVWWDFTPPSVTLTAPANGTDFFGG